MNRWSWWDATLFLRRLLYHVLVSFIINPLLSGILILLLSIISFVLTAVFQPFKSSKAHIFALIIDGILVFISALRCITGYSEAALVSVGLGDGTRVLINESLELVEDISLMVMVLIALIAIAAKVIGMLKEKCRHRRCCRKY
mmetsp:Transcript_6365/g.15619  ORF Transcript_6365/g.15619 Transcript_6365/m.15619 type:complete len:143 (-) Transcript_6365:405-833(-)